MGCAQTGADMSGVDAASSLEPGALLTTYLGVDDVNLVDVIDEERAFQERVAACMAAIGFEYQMPNPEPLADSQLQSWNLVADSPDLTTRQDSGYGITAKVVDSLTLLDDPQMSGGQEATDSPDYLEALWGREPEAHESEGSGCFHEASSSAYDASSEELIASFFTRIEDLQSEPEMIRANDQWANCARGFGYAYQSYGEMIDDFRTAANDLFFSSQDQREFEALRQREVDIATDLFECDVNYDHARRQAIVAVEEEMFGDQ